MSSCGNDQELGDYEQDGDEGSVDEVYEDIDPEDGDANGMSFCGTKSGMYETL